MPTYSDDENDKFTSKVGIMYFVPAKGDSSTQRMLVYLNQKQEFDDLKLGPGWFVQVPDEDAKRIVTITGGKQPETMTVEQLFAVDGRYVNKKFKNRQVTVAGPFITSIAQI